MGILQNVALSSGDRVLRGPCPYKGKKRSASLHYAQEISGHMNVMEIIINLNILVLKESCSD